MKPDEFDVSLSAGEPIKTLINFNHSDDARHYVEQHGIMIVQKTVSSGVSFADALTQGGTPGFYQRVWIDLASYGWRTISKSNGSKVMSYGGSATVAHELAHTCAVWHHGDSDKELSWEITEATGDTNWPPYIVKEGPLNIVLKEEPDVLTCVESTSTCVVPFVGTSPIWLGMPRGQHSGVEDCFMRYDNAYAYPQRNSPNVRFLVSGDELTGIFLCNSPTGTGVNDPAHSPRDRPHPRYGDAADKRGNCKSQVCVNDHFMTDAKHQR